MFRANVYSMEPLSPPIQEAVHDGIGMVAAYMGQTVAAKDLLVRLPLNEYENVAPERIGFGRLDGMVELHVMAVPLERGEGERIGLGGVGRGWAFVNTRKSSVPIVRSTTSHEVAHAFGFVLPDAEQADPGSKYHCASSGCVMHKMVVSQLLASPQEVKPNHSTQRQRKVWTQSPSQFDFCVPCKVDLRNHGDEHLAKLRHNRLRSGKVTR